MKIELSHKPSVLSAKDLESLFESSSYVRHIFFPKTIPEIPFEEREIGFSLNLINKDGDLTNG